MSDIESEFNACMFKPQCVAARAALKEIVEECQNTGKWSPVVQERMIERIELIAMLALDAMQEAP